MTLRYSGQSQTCARCHQTARHCRGKAIAKKCELAGGVKIEFSEYILNLWKQIGYNLSNTTIEDINEKKLQEQVGGNFTPVKDLKEHASKYSGVSIKGFPKDVGHGLVIEFLLNSGMSEDKKGLCYLAKMELYL